MLLPEIKFINFHSHRKFGVELEVNQKIKPAELVKAIRAADPEHEVNQSSTYQQDYGNKYWHVKFDRSCGDIKDQGGWEVASYVAAGFKDIEKMYKVTEAIRNVGATVNDECGVHVHAEARDLKENQVATIVAYWIKMESVILDSLPKHRRNNKYCKPMSKMIKSTKISSLPNFWHEISPKDFGNTGRRVALNLCNYTNYSPQRKTIELRLPEGTVDGNEVKNWIRFYLHLIDSTKKLEFPANLEYLSLKESLTMMGLHGLDPFVILSKGLRDTKIWFLKRILKNSTNKVYRNDAQEILSNVLTGPESEPTKDTYNPTPVAEINSLLNPKTWWKSSKVTIS